MSKNKSLNKLLKKTVKRLDKTRNPLDKLARFGTNTSEIGHRVVRDGISQVKAGADNIVDITSKRLESIREEREIKDILQAQLDFTSADLRALTDVARNGVDIVADGLVDAVEEVSNTYDAYRSDNKGEKAAPAEKPAAKAPAKKAAAKKAA